MPDWKRFHAAMLAGTLQGELPNACELAWSWLDLSPDERRARVVDAIRTEAAARWLLQALGFVRLRLLRDAGIDPNDKVRLTAFDEAMRSGRATANELDMVRRFDAAVAVGQIAAELFPAASMPPAPADPQKDALLASIPALTDAIHGSDVGRSAPASLAALRNAIDTFAAAGQGFALPVAREHAWWLGMAWWAVGRGAIELGRNDEGRDAFERAAARYEQADDANSVAECRQRLRDLELHIAADFDSAAERELRALLVRQDPLGRVQVLTRFARGVGGTGDQFEAARVAEQAAQVLNETGYPDPEPGFDAAADRWVATAADGCTGHALFSRTCQVAEYWAAILGARASGRLKTDPAGSARAEHALRRITAWSAELFEQAGRAEDEAARRFAMWHPQPAPQPQKRPNIDATVQRTDQLAALDEALQKLRVACNEGASEALLTRAAELCAQAEKLGSRVHSARAVIEQVYVALALERFDDVPALTDFAVQILLAGQSARLSAFATGFERELYLMAINYKARALAAKKEHEAILATCEPVIRDIEVERARVSSPYQQSAFLATRAEVYEFVAAAAYRTDRLDLLLAVTELLKARAALRSRLAPAVDVDVDDIEASFRQANEALLRTAPGSDEERELHERRRWLLTARAIARARVAGTTPEISAAALQGVLEADEAALSWFWIGSDIAILLALTREGMHKALVKLDPAQQAQLREYLACVTALSGDSPQYAKLIPRTDELVAALGMALLPAESREFIASKSRLLLSPHRTLHLFPFHAAPWHDGDATRYLVERFVIRYVPNLSSLLLAWRGNGQGPVLAVGIAQFDDPTIPSLPNAETEAVAVAAAHGSAGQALVGATRAQFAALRLNDYRCLHLATHGSSVLAGDAVDDPMQSCLYLRDGALSGWEIAALPLRAELVVLAACHSGQRSIAGRGLDKLPGDEIFGLQAVLFEAGVGTVLGALWPVEDATAQAILVAFHRAYAGGAAPDQALRAAILAYLANPKRRRDVFYWSPFFLSSLGRRV